MDLKQLRYAVAVADELHFGRAAEHLQIAQPSLSRRIRDLEDDLGVRLFDRTSRQVMLTAAGESFIEMARRTIRMADATRETAKAASLGWIGRVTLGFVTSAAGTLIPPLMTQQRSARPRVRLDLREMSTTQQVDALRSGEIDLGITRDLVGEGDLVVEPLFREPMLLAVSAEHPLHNRRAVSLRDLSACDFVTLPRRRAPRMWTLLSRVSLETGVQFGIAQEAQQFTTLLALVQADVGVAIVPESVRAFRWEGVRYLRLREQEAFSEVQLTHRALENRPVVRDLHRVIAETLSGGLTTSNSLSRD